MRALSTWFIATALLCAADGCYSVSPGQALTTTVPLESAREPLTYIGDASGKSCQTTLFWLIPLSSDSSIHAAKQVALADVSARYGRQAVALIDVSIDHDTLSWLVYERKCTWLRGKALGVDTQAKHATPGSTAPPQTPAQAP